MAVQVASSIGRSAVRTLRETFQGRITLPEDSGYESARKVWNGSIDRHPDIIVTPAHVADVQAAVRFGRERDMLVAVRSGGHSVAGHSTCDGGLVIDLSGMKRIRVDPADRRVQVQSGVLWGELDPETTARRLPEDWSLPQGWRASPSAAGSDGCSASTVWPATTSFRPRW